MKLKKSIMLFVLSAIFIAASVAVLPLSSGTRAEDSYVYKEITDFESLETKTEIVFTHTDGDKHYVLTAEAEGKYVVPKEYNGTADFTENMVWLYRNYDVNRFTLNSKAFPECYLTKLKIQKSGTDDYGYISFSDGQLFDKTELQNNHLSYGADASGGVYKGFNTTKYTVTGDNCISFCILKREKTQKQTYTVSFYDDDGTTVLSSQTAEDGTSQDSRVFRRERRLSFYRLDRRRSDVSRGRFVCGYGKRNVFRRVGKDPSENIHLDVYGRE